MSCHVMVNVMKKENDRKISLMYNGDIVSVDEGR